MSGKILDFCNISGETVKKFEGIKKYIATGDIIDNKISSYSEVDYNNKPSRANQIAKIGEVIFAKMKDTIKVITINSENSEYIYSTGFYIIQPKENVLTEYLYWLFNSPKFNIDKNKYCKGATQKALNNEGLNKIEINKLPDIKAQENIVYELNKTNEILNKKKEQLKALDELIKSQFVEMFGKIEKQKELKEYIISLDAGKSLAGEEECKNKVLKTGSVSYDYFNEKEIKNLPTDYLPKNEHKVNAGDVIISRMNTTELVGAVGYVWKIDDNIFIPDRLWKANLKNDVNPIFIWQLLIQSEMKEKIQKICSGTSGSMKNISKEKFLKLKVKDVSIELQNKFAEFVKQVDKQKFESEIELRKIQKNIFYKWGR